MGKSSYSGKEFYGRYQGTCPTQAFLEVQLLWVVASNSTYTKL